MDLRQSKTKFNANCGLLFCRIGVCGDQERVFTCNFTEISSSEWLSFIVLNLHNIRKTLKKPNWWIFILCHWPIVSSLSSWSLSFGIFTSQYRPTKNFKSLTAHYVSVLYKTVAKMSRQKWTYFTLSSYFVRPLWY